MKHLAERCNRLNHKVKLDFKLLVLKMELLSIQLFRSPLDKLPGVCRLLISWSSYSRTLNHELGL